jgi:hypothetical protein
MLIILTFDHLFFVAFIHLLLNPQSSHDKLLYVIQSIHLMYAISSLLTLSILSKIMITTSYRNSFSFYFFLIFIFLKN